MRLKNRQKNCFEGHNIRYITKNIQPFFSIKIFCEMVPGKHFDDKPLIFSLTSVSVASSTAFLPNDTDWGNFLLRFVHPGNFHEFLNNNSNTGTKKSLQVLESHFVLDTSLVIWQCFFKKVTKIRQNSYSELACFARPLLRKISIFWGWIVHATWF